MSDDKPEKSPVFRLLKYLLSEGRRKTATIGGLGGFVMVASTIALFMGQEYMTSEQWCALNLDVLRWGGSILVVGNGFERFTKSTAEMHKNNQ